MVPRQWRGIGRNKAGPAWTATGATLPGLLVGIHHWACGYKELPGREGTWRDAEDGELSGNPVAQGAVDSIAGFGLKLPAGGSQTLYYWLAVGGDFETVARTNRLVRERGPEHFLSRTAGYWQLWLGPICPTWRGLRTRSAANTNSACSSSGPRWTTRRHSCRQRLRYNRGRPRHLQLRLAARWGAGLPCSDTSRPRRPAQAVLRVIRPGANTGRVCSHSTTGRDAGLELAALVPRWQKGVANPGGRDCPRPLGPLAALPGLRRSRIHQAALPAVHLCR